MKVKVGDKIEIVNAMAAFGIYKNGDILTVQHINANGVHVQEHDRFIWPEEFIVLQVYKKGEKVRVIDKPWNHQKWGRLTRDTKKRHARHIGKEFEVATGNVLDYFGDKTIQVCHENTFEFLIVDLLEKVETEAQLTIEEKTREAHRIIGEIVSKAREVRFLDCLYNPNDTEIEYNGKRFIAKCSPTDKYDVVIGRMVALCKAVGRKLPEWV